MTPVVRYLATKAGSRPNRVCTYTVFSVSFVTFTPAPRAFSFLVSLVTHES